MQVAAFPERRGAFDAGRRRGVRPRWREGFPGGETMVEPWTFMNRTRAAEYRYTAQSLSAAEALPYGLVNRVVSADELGHEVEAMAAHSRQLTRIDDAGPVIERAAPVR